MKAARMRSAVILSLMIAFGRDGAALGSERQLDLSIDEAVSTALQENLSLQVRRREVEIARGTELQERGAFDSRLEAGVAARDLRATSFVTGEVESEESALWDVALRKRMTTGTEIGLAWENSRLETDSSLASIDPAYSSGFELSFSQQLMKGSSRVDQTTGIRAAEKTTAAASYLVERGAADLAAQVKKTYWELVFARQDIEVKKLSLELARNLWEETGSKIESGMMARVEIFQPESEIARREEGLIAAEKHLAAMEDGLRLLMNNRDWSASLVPVDLPEVPDGRPDLQAILENTLAHSPDILASELQVDAAAIRVAGAEDGLRPSLALVGAAGVQGVGDDYSGSLDASVTDPDFSWQVGLQLQVPIGNRVSRGSLDRTRAELQRSRLTADILRRQAEQAAREAVREVLLAVKTIEATRKTTLAAQKSLEADEEKFGVGLATAYDVLQSQDAYARALAGEKRALVDMAMAQAELERVQGLVSFREALD